MSCLIELMLAVALFVHGLFVQIGLEVSILSAIGLFALATIGFAICTFEAIRLRDSIIRDRSMTTKRF